MIVQSHIPEDKKRLKNRRQAVLGTYQDCRAFQGEGLSNAEIVDGVLRGLLMAHTTHCEADERAETEREFAVHVELFLKNLYGKSAI